jgi:putative phosphonate transport system ATP-binding protein
MANDGALMGERPILRVEGLSKRFGPGCPRCLGERPMLERNYCPDCGSVFALRPTDFELYRGEVLGIVGESGSGKSTALNCLYFDAEPTSGRAYASALGGGAMDIISDFANDDGEVELFSLSAQSRRAARNHVFGKVYQSPAQGLKMGFSAISNVADKLIASGSRHAGKMEARARELLGKVNIQEARMREPPANFSGGMQQRVQIAKALSTNPPILLLDEVTTGLDVSVQSKVLDMIKSIQRELGVSMLLVSHDLGVIRMLADRTLVMLDGAVVERGLTDQILEDPQHPYTQELVHSVL